MNLRKIAKTRQKYCEYLKDKRVVIVGPAPSILNSKQQHLIDSYDVIVRLNRALPLPEHLKVDIGSRTDVLYNCMNPSNECGGKIDTELLNKLGVKFLVSPYSPLKNNYRFKKDIEQFLKKTPSVLFCHIDPDYFNKLLKLMQLPNTGICAILDLLQQDIKELYITGFTFFKGGYIKEYRPYNEQQVLARMDKYKLHDQDKQLRYMKKKLLNDTRVKLDDKLREILEDKHVNFQVNKQQKPQNTQKPQKPTNLSSNSSRKKIRKIYAKTYK